MQLYRARLRYEIQDFIRTQNVPPHAGAPTRPVPIVSSIFLKEPTLRYSYELVAPMRAIDYRDIYRASVVLYNGG